MKKLLLTKEEAALEKEIESGEWVAVPNMKDGIKRYQTHARNALNKNNGSVNPEP